MGLALGSKYNALIAFFFLTMIVAFIYARDTGRQWKALKYGIIFCAISLLFALPLYMMTYVATGNPIYPLFDGLFRAYDNTSDFKGQILNSIRDNATHGLFQTRFLHYGEGFWETVL